MLTTGADEATQTVGRIGTDVIVVDEMGVEGEIPNVGKTELPAGAIVLDCATNATPEII